MVLSSVPSKTYTVRRFIVRYGVYVSLGLLLLVALLLTPNLYSQQTLTVLLKQSAQLGLIAIGQTLVLLVAGLDLSVGAVIFMTSVIIARVSNGVDSALPTAIGLSLLLSAVVGAANGLLITKRKIPPFVATLAIFILVQGAVQAYTRGVPGGFVPQGLSVVNQSTGFFSIPVVLWIGLTGLFLFVLRRTTYGRRLYAAGSNPAAAHLTGLAVDRLKVSAYVLCSLLACLAGVVLTGYVGYVDRFIASGLDLDAIAAAVVGGTLFTGGRGSVLGTFAGVLLIQVLGTMALLLGLTIQAQFIIKGLVILAAVALYSLARVD
ncbi:MAG: ABC transporter permease [Anaerolineae bacterium]|nr:ABC transporter permease [Anaerolineae bacterium]MBN8620102.1 ABC transporter permease [Anaerolineae bacterium]